MRGHNLTFSIRATTAMNDYSPNRYKVIGKIGEGVHGIVLKAIDQTTNKHVAIKKILLRTKHGEISPNAIREIKILQHCDHPNVCVFHFNFLIDT